jgi:hypothetical protein
MTVDPAHLGAERRAPHPDPCLQLEKMSICAAIGYRWDGKRTKLFFQTRDGSYNSPSVIQFLKDLKRELGDKRPFWCGTA